MPGSVGRGHFAAMALAILLAGDVVAQLPPTTEPTKTSTGPGSLAWPGTNTPTNPLHQPPLVPGPPTVLEAVPTPFAPDVPPVWPLPGSTEDQVETELAARRLFRFCTWWDTRFTLFPNSLLWTPPLASKIEPRMQALVSSLDNYQGSSTLDTSIGGTVGLFRWEPAGLDFAYQFDIFGVVHTRLTPDDLALADYRFGLPLSWRWGVYHGKVAYEHTSAHLGDEEIRALKITNISGYRRDEATVALGRYFDDCVRVYGQAAYAFGRSVPQPLAPLPQLPKPDPWRFDLGAEWAPLVPTGLAGRPFVAAHAQFRGDQSYKPNFNAQAGWMWHNPYQRLANFRVFVEYYNGRSPYGFEYQTREHFYGVGIAGDF